MYDEYELEEFRKNNRENGVYYKIGLDVNDKLLVIELQWFDESDYNREDFFTDGEGETLIFDCEEDVERWLNQNVKSNMMNEKHLKLGYRREDYLL